VHRNFVHDIPIWTGIDFHGGYECSVDHNAVYNCLQGINFGYIPNSSGNHYAGYNNSVEYNNVYINKYNNAASTGVTPANGGITVSGMAPTATNAGGAAYSMRVIGNTIDGYGNNASPPTAYSLYCSGYFDSLIVENNIIRNWSGHGIFMSGLFSATKVIGNEFSATLTTYSAAACIRVENNKQTISGSSYDGDPIMFALNRTRFTPGTGTPAAFGIVINRTVCVNGLDAFSNDFALASTAPYGSDAGGALAASYFNGQSGPLVVGGSGTPVQYKLKGTQAVAGVSSQLVTLPVTLSTSTYQIQLSMTATYTAPVYISAQTTSSFTITFGANYTGNVYWSVEV
jgi:hypothetical protein